MAIAQKWLAQRYNRPGFAIFDYDIYAVCGDGCLMEGIGVGSGVARRPPRARQPLLDLRQQPHHDRREHATSPSPRTWRRASSATAGTSCASATPTTSSGSSTRWRSSAKTKGRPTLIILDSHIGYGSPHKQDTAAAHGEPLGDEEVRLTKRSLRLARGREVPGARRRLRSTSTTASAARGAEARQALERRCSSPTGPSIPELAREIEQMQRRELPDGWDRNLPVFPADPKGIAGRDASGKVLNVLAQNIPWFLGGSADLGAVEQDAPHLSGRRDFQPGRPGGKNLHFGIREHAMGAIVNGLSLSKLRRVRRDLLHLQRLRAPGDPALGPDGAARRSSSSRTTRWATARTDRPTSPSSIWRRCAPSRGWSRSGPATPTRWSRPTATSCSSRTSRRCWCSRGSRCRRSTGRSTRRRRSVGAAPTSSPTRPTASPR